MRVSASPVKAVVRPPTDLGRRPDLLEPRPGTAVTGLGPAATATSNTTVHEGVAAHEDARASRVTVGAAGGVGELPRPCCGRNRGAVPSGLVSA